MARTPRRGRLPRRRAGRPLRAVAGLFGPASVCDAGANPGRSGQAAANAARDPVPEVAAEAVKTLEYYPSLDNARCLHGILDHPSERVREEARASFGSVRHEFLLGLRSRDQRAARHVRRWLEPVWEILAF